MDAEGCSQGNPQENQEPVEGALGIPKDVYPSKISSPLPCIGIQAPLDAVSGDPDS